MVAHLPNTLDLPDSVEPKFQSTLCVMITYRRVVGYYKSGKDYFPIFGGAVAMYPKAIGYKLDRFSLLPDCI